MPLIALLFAQPLQLPPSPTEPKAVVHALFDAFNRHDPAAMAALYADDAVVDSSDFCTPRGKHAIERTYRALFRAYPGIRDDVDTIVAHGERVAVRFTARDSQGNRPLSLPIINLFKVRGGKIVEDVTVFETDAPCDP